MVDNLPANLYALGLQGNREAHHMMISTALSQISVILDDLGVPEDKQSAALTRIEDAIRDATDAEYRRGYNEGHYDGFAALTRIEDAIRDAEYRRGYNDGHFDGFDSAERGM